MLYLHLQDTEGTREEAKGLVSKCLLQDVGGGGYRVHDLVLKFLKIKIKADTEMVAKAKELQAQYLGRLDVVKGYGDPEHGAGNRGLFVLDALWRSLEKLSGDPGLEVASYRASLGDLDSCGATAEVASCLSRVGYLFNIQVRQVSLVCLGFSPCCRVRAIEYSATTLYNVRCGFIFRLVDGLFHCSVQTCSQVSSSYSDRGCRRVR